jgi:hypothetical protein
MQNALMVNHNRTERYVDFDQMEYTPEIASALDIYADEMTTHSALQPMLNIKCSNDEIKSVLNILYHNILNINFNLFGWSRTMCKYGDYFLYLDIDENEGVMNAIGIPTAEIERLEGEDKTNANYIQYQWNSAGITLENWQIAHFRILGNDKYAPYGTSVLEPARRIWRQLQLMEDAMMAYRVVRAPERRVFKIDVGAIPPNEVEQYMQKVMTSMKRNSIVDDKTGRVDLRYNPLSVEEDFFIPVRGSTSSEIQSLPGGTFTGDIDDVKYLRDKLFSALKIPAAYLTQSDTATEDKTTLAQKDIRFSRTVQRLQRVIISELEKIGIIHLYTLGFRNEDLLAFELALNNPSKIAELQELEHWSTKFDVASKATEGFFSRRWITEHLFNVGEEEFLRNQREIFYDRKYDAQLSAVAEQMQEESAGLGGDLGGDLGDLGGDLGDLGGDMAGELGDEIPEEPGAEGAEDILLATPGEEGALQEDAGDLVLTGETRLHPDRPGQEQEEVLAPGGKTYWKDVNPRPRNKAKRKNLLQMRDQSRTSKDAIGATPRTTNLGSKELGNLATGNIYESAATNYSVEEKQIFNTQKQINILIESLEKKE